MIKNKIINYLGSKYRFTDIINCKFKDSDNEIYFEPFLGSAVVFLNTVKEYDEYIINDIDPKVIRVMNSFKEVPYSEYIDFCKMVRGKFGILIDKGDYNDFRSWFNRTLFNSDTIEEGLGIYILANSSFGSLCRFSKDGFNVPSGERTYIQYNKKEFSSIQSRLKRATILNLPFEKIDISEMKNADVFLDPPYLKTTHLYDKKTDDQLKKYIMFINDLNKNGNKVVGTDTKCMLEEFGFDFTYEVLRVMGSPVPYNTKKEKQVEIIYEAY